MAKTRRQTHFRQRRGGACVDAVASAFFAFLVVWWPRPPFVDSSFEGNVRCRIILIVEKFLLRIRSFPFLRRLSTLLHGFHCWLLASTFCRPADNHRGSLANMKRCLRHHVIGCPPFTVGPTVPEFVSQFHWSASAVALRNAEKKKKHWLRKGCGLQKDHAELALRSIVESAKQVVAFASFCKQYWGEMTHGHDLSWLTPCPEKLRLTQDRDTGRLTQVCSLVERRKRFYATASIQTWRSVTWPLTFDY